MYKQFFISCRLTPYKYKNELNSEYDQGIEWHGTIFSIFIPSLQKYERKASVLVKGFCEPYLGYVFISLSSTHVTTQYSACLWE